MQNHFMNIGFPLRTQADFSQYVGPAIETAKKIQTPLGAYLHWSSGSGAELWVQVDGNGSIVGMNPHFAGKGRMKVGLRSRLHGQDRAPLEGSFMGWANPTDASAQSGDFPFIFDSPNFVLYNNLPIPSVHNIQLTAFAHEMKCHVRADEFDALQHNQDLKFSTESAIAVGMFDSPKQQAASPQPIAMLTGHIMETSVFTNPLSGVDFHWVRLKNIRRRSRCRGK